MREVYPMEPKQMTAGQQMKLLEEMKPVASKEPLVLDELHMKQTNIASVSVIEATKGYVDNKWVDPLPVPQKQLYVESAPLKTVKDGEGNDVPLVAREWFNLIIKQDGTVGWSTNEKGKLHRFLKAIKVSHPKDLMGKPCIIKVVDKVDQEGSKTQLLRFMY